MEQIFLWGNILTYLSATTTEDLQCTFCLRIYNYPYTLVVTLGDTLPLGSRMILSSSDYSTSHHAENSEVSEFTHTHTQMMYEYALLCIA